MKELNRMKHNILFFAMLILVGLIAPISYSQTPTYTMTLANDAQVSATEYQFDIYLLRTGSTPFELALVQMGILYNDAVRNNGTLTCSYVANSTDPAIVSSGQQNTFNSSTTSTAGILRIIGHLASGGPGSGAIISNVAPGTKIGRLRIVNSVSFAPSSFGALWSFATPYITKVFAYVSSTNTDITVPANHVLNLAGSALPVELNSFKSNVNERQVNLSWTTKTEINSSKFEINRALVGTKDASVTWSSVGVIPAAGSSNSPKSYSFTEKDLQAGKYQYRLKLIDNNGAFKFSDVVETEVILPKNFEVSQNYPNPFNPSTRINYSLPFDSRVTVEVYNITGEKMGQLVNEEKSAGYYSVNFNSSSLNKSIASGIYIYKLSAVDKSSGKSFSSIKKMMLLK
jgi:hypothetical protein